MTTNLRPDGGPLPTPDWLADILARCDWYQETEPVWERTARRRHERRAA